MLIMLQLKKNSSPNQTFAELLSCVRHCVGDKRINKSSFSRIYNLLENKASIKIPELQDKARYIFTRRVQSSVQFSGVKDHCQESISPTQTAESVPNIRKHLQAMNEGINTLSLILVWLKI